MALHLVLVQGYMAHNSGGRFPNNRKASEADVDVSVPSDGSCSMVWSLFDCIGSCSVGILFVPAPLPLPPLKLARVASEIVGDMLVQVRQFCVLRSPVCYLSVEWALYVYVQTCI